MLEYAATERSINQDIGSASVTVTDVDQQNFLSNTMQKFVKEKENLIYTLKYLLQKQKI